MSTIKNSMVTWFAKLTLLALAYCGLLAPAYAVTSATFVSNGSSNFLPIGFTYAGNKFVGSILDNGSGQNLLYSTPLTGGTPTLFGSGVTLAASYGSEHFVASSLGLGGFPSRDIYVAEGNNIHHLSNTGADLGVFVNPGTPLNGDVRGITFDSIGTFVNQMLVTTHNGYVYSINSIGKATQIGATGEDTEGLDVAPTGAGAKWGGLGLNGALFVASESGTIRAITPGTYTMSTVIPAPPAGPTLPGAEELTFVPLNLGAGGGLEGLYSANFPSPYPTNLFGDVQKISGNQFAGMEGDIIITSESGHGIFNLNLPPASTTPVFGQIGTYPNQPEDGLFITAAVINGSDTPEPATLGLLGLGGLALLGRRRCGV